MNKKLTSSLFPSQVTLLFFTNSIFLWSSSLLLRFVEGIMRPYHSSNQHKHFKKIKYNERAAPLFSTTKEYLTFYGTNNYKNSKNNPCAASIFNETDIFRIRYILLIYKEKRKEEKQIWIRTIILATQNSMNKKNVP